MNIKQIDKLESEGAIMLKYSIFTNPGTRPANEDSAGVFENDHGKCFILCDGLGGHGMGDAASQLVVKKVGEAFEKCEDISQFNAAAFQFAQDELLDEQKRLHAERKMKTTAVILTINNENAYIGHIGDSRIYIFRRNKVKCRTLDHSVPQMLALTKEIKESEIRHHPDRSLILRVMGTVWEDPQYDLMQPVPLNKCQAFLLCSDGFWELIEEKEMCCLLKKSSSPEEWLNMMAETVKRNGKGKEMDNFTAIAVWNVK